MLVKVYSRLPAGCARPVATVGPDRDAIDAVADAHAAERGRTAMHGQATGPIRREPSRREREVQGKKGTTGWQVRCLDASTVGLRDCL